LLVTNRAFSPLRGGTIRAKQSSGSALTLGRNMKRLLRILFVSLAVLTLVLVGSSIWHLFYEAKGYAAAKADWLPRTASDIYYSIDSANRRYDFSISEADFRTFLLSLGYTPVEIKKSDFVYYRPMPRTPQDMDRISDSLAVTN